MQHRHSLIILPALALAAGCAVNPVTGKRQISFVTEGQEVQIGAQNDQAIVGQYGLVQNKALADYLNDVGQRLAKVSHRPDLPFHFRLLDDPVVNAFALPGGYTYMTRGILAYLNSEAAMAGVMGHEVGHVTAKHGVDRMTKSQLLGLGIGVGAMVSDDFAAVAGLASGASQLLLLKFGRDDERQSDELGVEYATKIGYDTHDMANFFKTLDNLSGGGGGLPEWASTHPNPGDRFVKVNELTEAKQKELARKSYVVDRNAYLRRIDGMVFGPNPRNGFKDGDTFYHPDLKFHFPVPSGWMLQNSAAQVQMGPKEANYGLIFTLGGESGTAADAAAVMASKIPGATKSEVRVKAGKAFRVEGTITQEAQGGQPAASTTLQATFIDYEGKVFQFLGIAPPEAYEGVKEQLASVSAGFGPETNPEILNIKPMRIKLIEASSDGTFQALVADHKIPEAANMDGPGLALLNGMESSSVVKQGTLLKVIVQN